MVRAVLSALAIVVLAAAGVALYFSFWREDTISIRVRGLEEAVTQGTTLVEAAERFGLRPASGDLLDVQGGVLKRGAFPGRLLLNHEVAAAPSELEEDDRLRVVDGESRREPTMHVFVRVPGGIPANPQFTLARAPGVEIERGRLSGKVDPDATHPSGPWRTPQAIALTFDDGPSPDTRRILAVLKRLHVRATFFVVGRLAERYPKLVRRELAAGMGGGSHSYSHPYRPPFERLPQAQILEEIERANGVLRSLWRVPSRFRPPGGSFSAYVIEASGVYGERIVLWSVDPTDWKAGTSAKQIVRRVLGAVRPGSIVLLHDGGGDRSQTVKALPEIVSGIREKGLKLVLLEPRR